MTATIIESNTFEEIVSSEDWDIPCICSWHQDERGPAEWVVVLTPWCCSPGGVKFWCNECLKEVMAYDMPVKCGECGVVEDGFRPKYTIVSVEPIHKEAA